MIWKAILIILVILVGFLFLIPLVLRLAGVDVVGFGLFGGGGGGGTGRGIMTRSSDGGALWEGIEFRRETNLPLPSAILDLAFHPTDQKFIFAGTRSAGLWKSEDEGLSWHPAGELGALSQRSDVERVIISRANPEIIYIAATISRKGRVLKSEDGGKSFREVYQVTADGFGVFDMYVSPRDSNRIIIATGEGGVLESRDGGREWRVVRWFGESLRNLTVNPSFEREIVIRTTRGRLLRTSDGGANWIDATRAISRIAPGDQRGQEFETRRPFGFGGGTPQGISAFAVDPRFFPAFYVAFGSKVVHSGDGGISWENVLLPIPPASLPVSAIAVHPLRSETLFAGTGARIWRSDDGGVEWRETALSTSLRIQELFIHPLRSELMFAVLSR